MVRAWDDPLRRAVMSGLKAPGGLWGRDRSRAAYNAYFREYRRRRKAALLGREGQEGL